jgi:hypothetical protein
MRAPYPAATIPYPSPSVCDPLCTPNPASIIVVIKNAGEKPMSTNDLRVSRAIGSINLKYGNQKLPFGSTFSILRFRKLTVY